METALVQLDALRMKLAQIEEPGEVKHIRDRAEALRAYAKTRGESLLVQNEFAEVKLIAERRAGEMLAEMERAQGARTDLTSRQDAEKLTFEQQRKALGIEDRLSRRWQLEARVSEDIFIRWVTETKASGDELTSDGLQRLARSLLKPDPADPMPIPDEQYRCLVIDPPWPMSKIQRDARPLQALALDYPTMTLEEIGKLPIGELGFQDGCHVYLWVTHKFLPAGLEILGEWGAKYQCLMTWVKPTGITPYSWMYNTEHVLFGTIGSLPLVKRGLKLSFEAPVTMHSEKPDIFYERVREASPAPRLDMFGRKEHDGFDIWGDQREESNRRLAVG